MFGEFMSCRVQRCGGCFLNCTVLAIDQPFLPLLGRLVFDQGDGRIFERH
jgi:hypothetical protein